MIIYESIHVASMHLLLLYNLIKCFISFSAQTDRAIIPNSASHAFLASKSEIADTNAITLSVLFGVSNF